MREPGMRACASIYETSNVCKGHLEKFWKKRFQTGSWTGENQIWRKIFVSFSLDAAFNMSRLSSRNNVEASKWDHFWRFFPNTKNLSGWVSTGIAESHWRIGFRGQCHLFAVHAHSLCKLWRCKSWAALIRFIELYVIVTRFDWGSFPDRLLGLWLSQQQSISAIDMSAYMYEGAKKNISCEISINLVTFYR